MQPIFYRCSVVCECSCVRLCLLFMSMSPTKIDELIKVPFRMYIHVGPRSLRWRHFFRSHTLHAQTFLQSIFSALLDLVFICNGLLCIFVFFCVSLDHFGFVFSNFILLGLVFSVLSQEIGWEERLRNDLFCVECDVKPYSVQLNIIC